jgi:hypothetical protein
MQREEKSRRERDEKSKNGEQSKGLGARKVHRIICRTKKHMNHTKAVYHMLSVKPHRNPHRGPFSLWTRVGVWRVTRYFVICTPNFLFAIIKKISLTM